jgi:hypothetical protein
MERVHTLINKLKEQLEKGDNAQQLLNTTYLLSGELQGLSQPEQQGKVTVLMPNNFFQREEVIIVTKTIEPVIELEAPAEIGVKVEHPEIPKIETLAPILTKPKEVYNLFVNDSDMAPTLALQEKKEGIEINDLISNDSKSFNDIFKGEKKEVASSLVDTPVKDLRKAIGINEKYIYISELFQGDEAMYERSIKTINGFSVYPEAEQWIKRELFTKLCWEVESQIVKQFDQLVRRRFA